MTIKQRLARSLRIFGYDIIRYTPTHHPEARLLKLIQTHNIGLILDVGANEGQYASGLREVGYHGRIVSFEPLASAYRALELHCRTDPAWEARNLAIGAEPGTSEINIAGNSTSSSLLDMLPSHLNAAPDSKYIGTELIEVDTIDRQLPLLGAWTGDIWLKIDTQGYEAEVIKGALKSLPQIRCIQLEMSLLPLYDGSGTFISLLDQMTDYGYDLIGLQPGFMDAETGRLLQVDGIFALR